MFQIKERTESALRNTGLLFLRVGAGAYMMLAHGWGKFQRLLSGAPFKEDFKFDTHIGLGPQLGFLCVVGAEFICAAMVVLGFLTRVFSAPVAFAMLVAAFIAHNQPTAEKPQFPFEHGEKALLYAIMFGALILLGGGKFSLDHVLAGWRAREKQGARR